jgi:DNA-binding XRE family transcriptional regulator
VSNDASDRKQFGDLLQQAFAQAKAETPGFTQDKLARQLGVSKQAVSGWMGGRHRPETIEVAKRLEALLRERGATFEQGALVGLWARLQPAAKPPATPPPGPAWTRRRVLVGALLVMALVVVAAGVYARRDQGRGGASPPAATSSVPPSPTAGPGGTPRPLSLFYDLPARKEFDAGAVPVPDGRRVDQPFTARSPAIEDVAAIIGRQDVADQEPAGLVQLEVRDDRGLLRDRQGAPALGRQQAVNNANTVLRFPATVPVTKGHRYWLRVTNLAGVTLGFYVGRHPDHNQPAASFSPPGAYVPAQPRWLCATIRGLPSQP